MGTVSCKGTVCPMLHRLEEAGLLASHAAIVDGRKRRLHRADRLRPLTRAGRAAFDACRAAFDELAGEMLGRRPSMPDPPPTAARPSAGIRPVRE